MSQTLSLNFSTIIPRERKLKHCKHGRPGLLIEEQRKQSLARKRGRWPNEALDGALRWLGRAGPDGDSPGWFRDPDATSDKWVMITRRPRPRVALVKLTLLRGCFFLLSDPPPVLVASSVCFPLSHARTFKRARHWVVSCIEMLKLTHKCRASFSLSLSLLLSVFLSLTRYACTREPPRSPSERTGRTHRCYGTTGRALVKRLVAARPSSPAVKVALATARTSTS